MHYYTFHPAKFNHETKMLSRLERAIYRELIDEYTGQECPFVADFDKLAWRLAIKDDAEKQALKVVLDNFFELKADKKGNLHYHHPRLDREIRAYKWHKKDGTATERGGTLGTDLERTGTERERKERYKQERQRMIVALTQKGVNVDKSMGMADLRTLFNAHCGDDVGTLGTDGNGNGTDGNGTGTPKSDVKQLTSNNKPVTSNQDISPQTPQGAGEIDLTVLEKTDETTKTKTAKTQTAPKTDKPLNVPFETFWDAYDKKIDPKKCKPLWERLTDKDRLDAMAYIPKYKQAQPDKQFRKNPQTFLNARSWESEIIDSQPQPTQPKWGGANDPLAVNDCWKNYDVNADLRALGITPTTGDYVPPSTTPQPQPTAGVQVW